MKQRNMSDIALFFNKTFKEYDPSIRNGDLALGEDLESAVIISLFTWGRCQADETEENASRYGWWGDKIETDSVDGMGSKLYLLKRQKITEETIQKAREYIEQALKWLLSDDVAEEVTVSVERSAVSNDRIDAVIVIRRGDKRKTLRFNDLWSFL